MTRQQAIDWSIRGAMLAFESRASAVNSLHRTGGMRKDDGSIVPCWTRHIWADFREYWAVYSQHIHE